MNLSEILASTANYLRQLAAGTAGDEEPIAVSESLLRELESASTDVKKELERKLILKMLCIATHDRYSHRY